MSSPSSSQKSRAGIWVGIASMLAVGLLAFANIGREAPGPVSAVHAGIEAIEGGTACSACHGGWFGNMQKACTDCHEDIAAQIADGHGLHGGLAKALAADCSTCHSEHHGTDFQLVNRLAFAQAGVPDVAEFDHSLVGFQVAGKHVELECAECHHNAEIAVLPEGQKRYLGLSQDCATCHDNPHNDRMQLGCATCHSQNEFHIRFVPTHDQYLSLDGAHADVTCRQCHLPGTPQALEAMREATNRQARSCADCHDSPHADEFVAGNALSSEVPTASACAVCHPLEYETFDDERVTVDAAQHAHSGFALKAPHGDIGCEACHDPDRPYAERHPGRARFDCRSCHQDPHGGQFDTGPFAARGCVSCHAETHFLPHEFGPERHALSSFALDGAHESLDCSRCHEDPAVDEPRQFHGTANRCELCHGDAHEGAFAAIADDLATNPRGTCAECHRTDSFADADLAAFHHGQHTGFGIEGAHSQIECTDCHPRTDEPDRFGRRFGRIVPTSATFGGCVTCHEDPHSGQFDREGVPAVLDGRSGCARCHDTASFRALPHGFAHGPFTGFELVGQHAELDCAACHPLLAEPDASGRESQRARGTECADCHEDPHMGQFERLGRNDCSRCHKSFETFARVSFRHNLDSRFHLGDAHRKVPCASCHKLEEFGSKTAIRYKPLPSDCVECHGTDRPRIRR